MDNTAICAREGQRSDGADVALGDEAHEDTLSFFGDDPIQERFDPATAPRSGRIPILQDENIRPEAVDKFVDHAGRFSVIRPTGGPDPPFDEVVLAFENHKRSEEHTSE